MAKKKADVVTEVATIPVEDERVESQIDMKLTKQDLIDMVIEENREVLEKKLKDATARNTEEEMKLQKAIADSKNKANAFVLEVKKEFFKKFKDLGKVEIDNYAASSINIDDKGVVKEDPNDYRNNSRPQRDQISVRNGFNFFIKEQNKKRGEDGFSFSGVVYLNEKQVNEVYADLIKQLAVRNKAYEEYLNTAEQNKNIDKMGKKAKAQLIKNILNGSAGGQAILENMSGIKNSIATALLESAKK